jgi:DNA polymerase-3 subunit gamma/tau
MAKRASPPAEREPHAGGEYTVLARRYRPRQFDDIVGQEPVTRALVNALTNNRVAHAYLFTGARGVGKTSTARILAKALNCVKGPTATPCDQCDSCRAIATGEDIDVVEIDGASNRQIDDVRELRSNVQYRPSRSRYKIYIVDEVHMLTKEAFNALLKTLEEPPPHVKFLFATTDIHKVPVTILSRCQRFDFAGIGAGRIAEQLQMVAEKEGVQADPEALELLSRRAGGSMRDAQSLLDQLLAFGDDGQRQHLSVDAVHQLLGMADEDRVAELAASVLDRDPKRALDLVAQTVDAGAQLNELLDQLIDYWRDLMVVASTGMATHDLTVPARHRDALTRQAQSTSLDTILAGLDVLATTKARMRSSGQARVLLEMALVRLSRLHDLVALSELTQWLEKGGVAGAPASSRPSSASPRPAAALAPEKKSPERTAEPLNEAGPVILTEESLGQTWPKVLAQVGNFLANDLRNAESVKVVGSNTLVLRFPAGYNPLHGLGQESNRGSARIAERVEETLRKLTGYSWSVRIESVGNGAVASSTSAADTDASLSRTRRQMTDALQVPLVKRACDLLGAQFVRMDEGFASASPDTAEGEEP